jgi:hypothetical protein
MQDPVELTFDLQDRISNHILGFKVSENDIEYTIS